MSYRDKFRVELNVIKLLLFTIATSFVSFGQEKNEDDILDSLLDDLFFNDKEFVDDILNSINQYDYLYTTATYNSNTYFAGRDSGLDQFSFIPQISYYSSSGFNATISSVYYENQSPNWDFVSLSAGYSNTIGKKKTVHYNIGYSRFFFNDDFDSFNNSIDFMLGARTDNSMFGVLFSGSYLFGTDQSVQLSSRIYGNIPLTRQSNFALKFKPQVSFLLAQQAITLKNINSLMSITTEEFGLLNTQLNLPVSFATSSWDFELSWNLNLPSPLPNEKNLNSTNFFALSIGYLLDLKKK
ncbi:MAG: hypothetical protein ACI9EK_002420 [Psychroserpens sp.]|jgi:hypothetical protein